MNYAQNQLDSVENVPAAAASKPLTVAIAEQICGFEAARVSRKARAQALAAITDTIGVTLAGASASATRILLATLGSALPSGNALIFGTRLRTAVPEAALVNGVAAHALDYDDFSSALGGHQSVPLVPALFALADEFGASGEKVLLAYLVGVEAEVKFGRAVNFHHYDKGWHPTSTLGIFGTVAAASHLLEMGVAKTATALAIAASLSSGIKANFGTMVKPLHVGQCGRNGLMAVLLAQNGFDANLSALEHHQGFLNVFNGEGYYATDHLRADWAGPLEIEAPTMSLKQFPCCGSTHPAVMMMLKLAREEGITADDVKAIDILMHERRLRHVNNPRPGTALEAKFSVQYVTARALLCGTVRLEDFEGLAFEEPAIRRLLGVTSAARHPGLGDSEADQWGAEVVVTLTDGRRLSRFDRGLVGRGGGNPMSRDELREKFANCAARALTERQIGPLFDQLMKLDELADLRRVTALLMAE